MSNFDTRVLPVELSLAGARRLVVYRALWELTGDVHVFRWIGKQRASIAYHNSDHIGGFSARGSKIILVEC